MHVRQATYQKLHSTPLSTFSKCSQSHHPVVRNTYYTLSFLVHFPKVLPSLPVGTHHALWEEKPIFQFISNPRGIALVKVLASYCCSNKLPYIQGLKQVVIYSFCYLQGLEWFLETEKGIPPVLLSLETLKKIPFSAFLQMPDFLGSWLHHSILCLQCHTCRFQTMILLIIILRIILELPM